MHYLHPQWLSREQWVTRNFQHWRNIRKQMLVLKNITTPKAVAYIIKNFIPLLPEHGEQGDYQQILHASETAQRIWREEIIMRSLKG